MSDIYKTPKANLEAETSSSDNFGSIEQGINGDYRFFIFEVIGEAWEKTYGSKLTLVLAFILYIAVSIGLSFLLEIIISIISSVIGKNETIISITTIFYQLVLANLVLLPIWVGVEILGIRRSADVPIQLGSIMNYFSYAFRLLFTYLLMAVMIFIGLFLLVLPGIYLSVAYLFALPLVVEKGLSPWEAMEVSRKVITKRWFRMFFFSILIWIIVSISFALIIGWIWAIPMAIIAYGIAYRNMFGIRDETLAE